MGEIYVVSNKEDIKYIKDLLSHCKALKKVINYKPTNIQVFVGGIDIGCTDAHGDYYWGIEDDKSLGFYLPEGYNNKLWKFMDSLEYRISDEDREGI